MQHNIKNTVAVGLVPVITKYYTRFVTSSDFQSAETDDLLTMKMQKLITLFHASKTLCTEAVYIGSFALLTWLTAGDSDNIKIFYINELDDKYLSSILTKFCHDSKSVPFCNLKNKNAVCDKTRVTAGDSDKMKIFYIDGLDDNYLSSTFIKCCHDGKSVPVCNSEHINTKQISNLDLFHWVIFVCWIRHG